MPAIETQRGAISTEMPGVLQILTPEEVDQNSPVGAVYFGENPKSNDIGEALEGKLDHVMHIYVYNPEKTLCNGIVARVNLNWGMEHGGYGGDRELLRTKAAQELHNLGTGGIVFSVRS